MKAIIKEIEFKREVNTKFGLMYQFNVKYDNKIGTFLAKKKNQTTFKENEENEFTEQKMEYQGVTYYKLKKVSNYGGSQFTRNVKREQSKYSGFAMSYAKDLAVCGMAKSKTEMFEMAEEMLEWMLSKDKVIGN